MTFVRLSAARKEFPGVIGFMLALVSTAAPSQPGQPNPISPAAVWQPGMGFMQAVHTQCGHRAFPALGDCFAEQMARSGAPPAAVRFAHRIGNQGFLRDFRKTGQVSIAYADYVFAANENQHVLLVNGRPAMIDVDNLELLGLAQLERNAVYRTLKRNYPRISVWPGDRSGTRTPIVLHLPNHGQRFVVKYRLQNFCHACSVIGAAEFAFDFDRQGNFLATKLVGVQPGSAISRSRPLGSDAA